MNSLDGLPPSGPLEARRWLWLIVATLVAAFSAVGGLQWQQYRLLNDSVRFESGNVVWIFFQLEVEYLKLRDTLRDIDRDPGRLDRDALQTRYDIFVSRVALVDPTFTVEAMVPKPEQTETVMRVQGFVAAADVVLGVDAARPIDAQAARALLAKLEPLAESIHDMSQWANDAMEAQVGARSEIVRRHNRTSIALMGFQLLLTIAFAVIVVRQFRALEQRGGALERLAERLQGARSDAEAGSRAKSAFLANMSHELRTPFQGVLGMLALIEDGPLNTQQSDQLQTARESALHLLTLVNDVLDVSTLEQGKLRLVPAPTDLHRLLSEVEALMTGPARAKALTLRVLQDADVPTFVLADATRLKQILFNLLGNAIKFTDTGEVLFETRLERDAPGDPRLSFVVTDTGIGMDEATLGKLFQRFSQSDESTSRRFGGTGLGLEISRNLASMMDGDIHVTSELGRGSRFTLRVPLPRCEPPAVLLAAPASPDTRPLRVLVAEDHPINQKYVRALLARLGHDVTLRENGRLAFDAATEQDFDLILMDLHMPVMDGLAATSAIRALAPPRGSVPIVALTADAFPETREKASRAGMNDFLSKPVQPAELQAALFRLFGRAGMDSALPVAPGHADSTPTRKHPPVFDPSVLAQLPMVLDGSEPEFAFEVLEEFHQGSGETVELCRRASGEGDEETAQRCMHTLKSTSAQVGALALAECAKEMELLQRGGQHIAQEGFARLRVEHRKALRLIAQHLARNARPVAESVPA